MVQTVTLVNKKLGTEAALRLDMAEAREFRDRTMVPLSYHQCWRVRRALNPGGVGNGKLHGVLGENPLAQRPKQSPRHEYRVIEDNGIFAMEIRPIDGKPVKP